MEADELDKRAAFATQFRGTTNLDQRRRFAQDISEAKAREEATAKAEFEQLQRADPALMNAVTNRMQEGRIANQADRQFQWDQEKQGLVQERHNDLMDFRIAQERRLLEKQGIDIQEAKLNMDQQIAQQADTLNLRKAEFEAKQKFKPGTQAYRDAVLEAAVMFPNVEKDLRNTILQRIGITDPDTVFSQAAEAVAAGAARATAKLPGGGTATFVKPQEENIDKDILRAMTLKERAIDDETRAAADELISSLRAKKTPAKPETSAVTQNQGTQVAVAPVRRKAKDGSIWEYDPTTKQALRKVE